MTTTVSLELTPEQIAKASRYLEATRDAVIELVSELSATQWRFKPAADRWSIAEIMEHLVLVDSGILSKMQTIGEAPEAPPEWDAVQVDNFIVTEIPKRPQRVNGSQSTPARTLPPEITPTHRWSGPEALALFLEKRDQNIEMTSRQFVRGHVMIHPVCGPWDGYQWLLAAAAHCDRHTGQIREVKAHPNFPKADDMTSDSPVNWGRYELHDVDLLPGR